MSPSTLESATLPINLDAVPELLDQIAGQGHSFLQLSNGSVAPRLDLLAKARALAHALETPREVMIEQVWSQPANIMAISFGAQTGVWTTMAENGNCPQKVADLATQLNMPEELLTRMLRHISASGYLDTAAPNEYTPNNFTRALATPHIASGYQVCPPVVGPNLHHTPSWFQERGFALPANSHDVPFPSAHNGDLGFFAYLAANPPHAQHFNELMAGYLMGRPAWMQDTFYPAQRRLIDGFDCTKKDAVLLVDIAGGNGHYTEQFRAHFADSPGRLVLQDLPGVIAGVEGLHPRIETMAYDFFTPQPVRGARCYYMHFILHDWPDADCVAIVSRIRDAMVPGYSRLLIHEHVVPETGHDHEQTGLDLLMMTLFGSKERSERQWRDLLEEKCGLRVEGVWWAEGGRLKGVEGVVECVRVD